MDYEFEIQPGVIASKLNLKENDVILITIDLDRYDVDETYSIFEIIQKAFPNNKVVCTFKGISIEKLRETSPAEGEF
jgi:predicted dinucleotide-binding enzyme